MAGRPRCICGCARPGRHGHHVVTQAEIKKHVAKGEQGRWLKDKRNIVPMDFRHHFAHHNASRRLWLDVLPDSCFEFAVELMGAGQAYEWFARYYRGEDPRLDALLAEA
jgi:hypothetical protein